MSYLKGKDIKVSGDCLVYCYTRRIKIVLDSNFWEEHFDPMKEQLHDKPEDFEKF